MGEATGSGGRGFRRECVFHDFEGRVLVIRWIDLRPGEVAEVWDFALWNLNRWLTDASKVSALAKMSLSASQAGGAAIGSMEQLRAKLEDAFRTRSLVVVRPGGKVRGDMHAPSEAHRTPRETVQAQSISSNLLEDGPKKFRRGWEVSGRSGIALVAKKADLMTGEPTEEPQVAVFYIDRWLANPEEKAILIEMYKAVYGFADSAWAAPSILKSKIEAAFEKRELVMLRQSHGGAGGGRGGGPQAPARQARRVRSATPPRAGVVGPGADRGSADLWPEGGSGGGRRYQAPGREARHCVLRGVRQARRGLEIEGACPRGPKQQHPQGFEGLVRPRITGSVGPSWPNTATVWLTPGGGQTEPARQVTEPRSRRRLERSAGQAR
jgi:hypothetical protein